MSFNKSLFSTK